MVLTELGFFDICDCCNEPFDWLFVPMKPVVLKLEGSLLNRGLTLLFSSNTLLIMSWRAPPPALPPLEMVVDY